MLFALSCLELTADCAPTSQLDNVCLVQPLASVPAGVAPQVKLIDLGFSKHLGLDSAAASLLGTPFYM